MSHPTCYFPIFLGDLASTTHAASNPTVTVHTMIRSMIGRRALGQLDQLLQQAKNNTCKFGNINVILVRRTMLKVAIWWPRH